MPAATTRTWTPPSSASSTRRTTGRCALFLGLVNPHPPYQVEEPYFSAVDRSKLPPRVRPEDDRGKPAIEAAIRANQNLGEMTEADWDEVRGCYLGMCSKVDDMFRRLCDALKQAGEYDNSAIFFFSDHGDYTGDHGIAEKEPERL